jgi:hypothetical protein
MIHATDAHFAPAFADGFHSHRPSSSARHGRDSLHRATTTSASPFSFGFAEPAIGSLWDAALLDRFTLPLTRYHE